MEYGYMFVVAELLAIVVSINMYCGSRKNMKCI